MSDDACDVPPPTRADNGFGAHLREDAWGIYVIAKREFVSNIKSFRSIVMVIILALIMVGAAMGFASLSTREEVTTDMTYLLVAMDPDGQTNDLVVFLYEARTFKPIEGADLSLRVEDLEIPEYQGRTNVHGQWVAHNLTPAFHWLFIPSDEGETDPMNPFAQTHGSETYIYVPHNSTGVYPVLGVSARQMDVRDTGRLEDVSVFVVSPDGRPAEGATVTMAGLTDTTDVNGHASFLDVEKGVQTVTATRDGLSGVAMVNVTHADVERDPFALALEGPDEVLRLVAAIAIGLVGPIYAIVLCFDSVFRERLSGSIDYLLCRPMGRRAVLLGKFTGILAALMVPITAVSMLGVGVITWASGTNPNTELVLGFIIYTVFLIAIFVLLQMIFSTVAKTTGTAILSGIGIWIFFFMLFDLILLLVTYVMDLSGDDQQRFYNRAYFLNPISIYSLAIAQLGTDVSLVGIPAWAPPVALVLLTMLLLLAAMEIFARRVTE